MEKNKTHFKFAVIPSKGRACLADCIEAVRPQVDRVIVVDTGEARQGSDTTRDVWLTCTRPNNISHWWNVGLNMAEILATTFNQVVTWDVAVLNDDAIVPPGWFDAVSASMRERMAAAGCSGGHDITWRKVEAIPLDMRMQGFAYMLRGEARLRANETLKWYFTDDYMDWESRKLGGMAMCSGYPVQHLYPNGQLTPELHEQIARDAQTFVDIYGMRPW